MREHSSRWRLAVLVAGFTLLGTGSAHADEAFHIGSQPSWFILGGLSTGGTVATDSRGAFVGGEASLVRVQDRTFLGLYADGYYDFAVDGTYLTAGPELGVIRRSRTMPIAVGIDGGAAFRFADDTDVGGTGRVYLTIAGSVSLYTRYLHFGTGMDDQVVQVGVALKFPLLAPFGAGTR